MPQMMPMNWITMFTSLNLIIMLLMIMLIYNYKTSTMKLLQKHNSTSNKWSW